MCVASKDLEVCVCALRICCSTSIITAPATTTTNNGVGQKVVEQKQEER